MSATGNKSGSLQTQVNCAGISVNGNLGVSGSTDPSYGVTAPAALLGTIGSNGASSCTLPLTDPSQTVSTSTKLAVFWTTNGGATLNACYDLSVSSASFVNPTNTATITQSGGIPTSGSFWASSGAAPSALPANGTLISVAVNIDLTQASQGVTIPGGSGGAIQQLLATSTQPGLIEWLKAAGSTQERLSAITAAGGYDTWPTAASQLGSLPSGGGGANWTSSDTVTVLRFYNLGSSFANVGGFSQSANMQVGVLLA